MSLGGDGFGSVGSSIVLLSPQPTRSMLDAERRQQHSKVFMSFISVSSSTGEKEVLEKNGTRSEEQIPREITGNEALPYVSLSLTDQGFPD